MPQDSTKPANGRDEEQDWDLEEIRSVRRLLQRTAEHAMRTSAHAEYYTAQRMANWLMHLEICSGCRETYWSE